MVRALAVWTVLVGAAHASSDGIANRSSGCASCHGGADSTVDVALEAVSGVVAPGATVSVTVTLSSTDPTHVAGGFTVEAAAGALAAGSGLRTLAGDVVQAAPRPLSGGTTSWTLTWTAPTAPGRVRLSVAGNAVNGNGRADAGDGWSTATLDLDVGPACVDADGDGVTDCAGDCDDSDPAVFPGAPERCNDRDDDCDRAIDEDAIDAPRWFVDGDGDGFGGEAGARVCEAPPGQVAEGGDCDDGDPDRNPGAVEIWYDGVDQDCDGASDFDQDGDGVDIPEDCDDLDPAVFPGALDAFYDGVDADCRGDDDFDADGDGFASASFGGTDCDDSDDEVYPGAPDPPGDGRVTDCLLADPDDADLDGFRSVAAGGTDCDDNNAQRYPGAVEIWYDGVDQDCDGNDDDQDFDGVPVRLDCDDLDPTVFPGAVEVWYDGVDQDCDGADDFDQDGDGERAVPWDDDCDDLDPTVFPGAVEVWYDGVDQDCDGNDDDRDRDGVSRGADCDDLDPTRSVGCEPVEPDVPAEVPSPSVPAERDPPATAPRRGCTTAPGGGWGCLALLGLLTLRRRRAR